VASNEGNIEVSDEPEKLTTKEAAAFIRRSPWTLRQYAATNQIPFYRLPGGQLLFDRSALLEWLRIERPRPKRPERKADTMGVYPRKDSPFYWMSYFTADGKIQESTATDSLEEAQQVYKRRLEELARGVWRHPKNRKLPFGELIDQYLESHAFTKIAPATQRMYRQRLAIVRERFGYSQVLSLTADDVDEFVKDRLDDEASSTTVFHDVATMIRVLNWANEKRLIPYLPFPTKGLKPNRAEFLSQVLGVEQEKAVLLAAEPYQRAMIIAALDAGLRKGEIFGQRWEHVDFGRNILAVSKSKGGTKGAGRPIPLTARLHATLAALPRECEQVFTYRGRPILTDTKKSWYRILEDAGVSGIRFHDLRATFSTRLEELGVAPMVSMALMGHKRKSVHDRYSRPQLPSLREGVAKLDSWLRENGLNEAEPRLRAVE
jgi:excisionase family DNA binding protein